MGYIFVRFNYKYKILNTEVFDIHLKLATNKVNLLLYKQTDFNLTPLLFEFEKGLKKHFFQRKTKKRKNFYARQAEKITRDLCNKFNPILLNLFQAIDSSTWASEAHQSLTIHPSSKTT